MSDGAKQCRKCGVPKDLSEFAKNKGTADGHVNICKQCHKAYVALHYQQNKQQYVGKAKRWKATHLERSRQIGRDHTHRYNEQNRTQVNARKAVCKRNNLPYYTELENRRRARKRNAFVAPVDRRSIYDRDRGTCHICKLPVPFDKMELDHVIPLAKGGEHSPRNVAVAHARCNRKKWTHLI